MSPKEPEPIFLPSLYLFPTLNSIVKKEPIHTASKAQLARPTNKEKMSVIIQITLLKMLIIIKYKTRKVYILSLSPFRHSPGSTAVLSYAKANAKANSPSVIIPVFFSPFVF